jgi:bifunctional DNA-binding transcriptional regulator/antitoxin component of YhaV-PrlF toxin-antitoxin module
MPKVYKSNNKLAISIPYDVISVMEIKEGDDLDFLKYGDGTFLIIKKNDIVKMLSKPNVVPEETKSHQAYTPKPAGKEMELFEEEISVLKKLDTLRYENRTSGKVAAILNNNEKAILQNLIKKRIVSIFKKAGDKESKYGIAKNAYDTYLYRKRPEETTTSTVSKQPQPSRPAVPKAWEQKINQGSDAYMEALESKGFLVLGNEAEAAIVSSSLEDSIRHGLVVGTRAFNKKFYIGLRGFINKHAAKILKLIDQKSMNVSDIASEIKVDEDGVRTILYVLSEAGDVTEVRKDIFRAA